MKARVDRDGCISCGLCVETCPKVFRFARDDIAEAYVDHVPKEAEETATIAKDQCPVAVIYIE